MGIPSNVKLDWVLTFLTQMLHNFSTNSVAVILMPNRSSAGSAAKDKDKDSVSGSGSGIKGSTKSDDEDDKMSDPGATSSDDEWDHESELRSSQWGIECKFAQKSRALKIRPFQLIFAQETIYGARDAVASGLLAVSSHGDNRFVHSPLWRLRAILDVPMLARDKMQKPVKRSRSGVPIGSHFTDAPERRRWYSGPALVTCVVDKLVPVTDGGIRKVTMIDCHQYDASTSCAGIEMAVAAGDIMSVKVASICHDQDAAQFSADKVTGTLHNMAKSKHISLAGFPDFEALQQELKALQLQEHDQQINVNNQLKVCVARVNGTLIIMDVHRQRWLEHESYKTAMQQLLDEHNAEFNIDQFVEQDDQLVLDGDDEPEAKRAKTCTSELPTCTIQNYQQLVNDKPDMS
jgi:hypothetical protein